MKFSEYATVVFDCDGVILDSNRIKTEAFHQAALPYGAEAARNLVEYHTQNGGISRYKKFEYFLSNLVPADMTGPTLQQLLATYAAAVKAGLASCASAKGLETLRRANPSARWLVASGGDQVELREVFASRGLTPLFDGGIFGSPDDKLDIVAREMTSGNILMPALFLGDSKYDHVVALSQRIDFVFLSAWSEFADRETYCSHHSISVFETLEDLIGDVEIA